MQSARGVFYDLLDSNYIYLHGNIRFYFSSKFYLNKFSLKIDEFIKNEKMKFLVNYKIDIDAFINAPMQEIIPITEQELKTES